MRWNKGLNFNTNSIFVVFKQALRRFYKQIMFIKKKDQNTELEKRGVRLSISYSMNRSTPYGVLCITQKLNSTTIASLNHAIILNNTGLT